MKKSKPFAFLSLCLAGVMMMSVVSGCTVSKNGFGLNGTSTQESGEDSSGSERKTEGKFVYRVKENGKAIIVSVSLDNSETEISFPEKLGGVTVDELKDYLLMDKKNLTKITLSSTINTFGEHTFVSCESLKEITIPEGTKVISTGMFKYCKSLTTVTLPSTITEIQDYAFANCTSLETINIPDNASLSEHSFSGCTSLKNDRVSVSDSSGAVSYGVTGSFAECENWTKDIPMKEGSSGIYKATVYNVSPGTYEFKVRANGEWTDSWGELDRGATYNSQINCSVSLERTSNVVITFDTSGRDVNNWTVTYKVE